MNNIPSRIAPGTQPFAPQGADSIKTPAPAPAVTLQTEVCHGTGALSGRLIAVGDRQSTLSLRDISQAPLAVLADLPPKVRALLEQAPATSSDTGLAHLKKRQLDHSDGQVTRYLRSACATTSSPPHSSTSP